METVKISKAKASLSRLVAKLERGELDEVVITRNGRPVAKLLPLTTQAKRIGVAEGVLAVPDDFDAQNEEIARMFNGA